MILIKIGDFIGKSEKIRQILAIFQQNVFFLKVRRSRYFPQKGS